MLMLTYIIFETHVYMESQHTFYVNSTLIKYLYNLSIQNRNK